MSRLAPFLATVALLGCQVTIPEGRYACTTGADCPPGFECMASFCVSEGTDAGRRDAGDASPPDAAVDAEPVDASPADAGPMDAGPMDAGPMDAGSDDAGRDAAVDGGPCAAAEICDALTQGLDDDCDDIVDEGCPYEIGVVHTPIPLHHPAAEGFTAGTFFTPEVSSDGLRIYFAHFRGTNTPVWMASRPSVHEPFDAPVAVPGTLETDLEVAAASITGDELELFVQARVPGGQFHIYSASRSALADNFGPFTQLTTTEGSQVHPSVSRDGEELFYRQQGGSLPTSIERIVRGTGGTFGARTTVVGTSVMHGAPRFPRISADNRTLVYSTSSPTLQVTRTDRDSPFAAAEPFPLDSGLPGVGFFFAPAAHELWFTVESQPDSAPMAGAIFRAQVCRYAGCDRPGITCLGSEVESDDGLRCFAQTEAAVDGSEAVDTCRIRDSALPWSLASIRLPAESNLFEMRGLAGWAGMQGAPLGWADGSPDLYAPWAAEEPRLGSQCSISSEGLMSAVSCDGLRPALCAREIWPSFVP